MYMKKLLLCLTIIILFVPAVGCSGGSSNTGEQTESNTVVESNQLQEDANYSEGLVFKSNGDGTCAVTGIGTCTDEEIKIPTKSRQGDVVISIGMHAFYTADFVKKVIIPDTVTEIGNSAFEFTNITEITIPDSVTFIDEHAFKNCSNLTTVNMSGGKNTVIGKGAFSRCYGLKEIIIPEGVTTIGRDCFYSSGIENVSLPISLSKIGGNAFNSCSSLNTITYNGTVADWMAVDTGVHWNYGAPVKEVTCTDEAYSIAK